MVGVMPIYFNSFVSALTYEFFFVLFCFPLVIALFVALINVIKG